MSDWQVGDLALCVDARPNPVVAHSGGLVQGRIYEVAGVVPSLGGKRMDNALYGMCSGLLLAGLVAQCATGAFAEPRFRKIHPDKHEACEDEFVKLLKRNRVSA